MKFGSPFGGRLRSVRSALSYPGQTKNLANNEIEDDRAACDHDGPAQISHVERSGPDSLEEPGEVDKPLGRDRWMKLRKIELKIAMRQKLVVSPHH
jgi:hypothetical protein